MSRNRIIESSSLNIITFKIRTHSIDVKLESLRDNRLYKIRIQAHKHTYRARNSFIVEANRLRAILKETLKGPIAEVRRPY